MAEDGKGIVLVSAAVAMPAAVPALPALPTVALDRALAAAVSGWGLAPAVVPCAGRHAQVDSHTVCRGPDGVVKWESDTEPARVPAWHFLIGMLALPFQVDTALWQPPTLMPVTFCMGDF